MKKLGIFILLVAGLLVVPQSCKDGGSSSQDASDAAAEAAKAPLKGDSAINRAARFYAGMSMDGIDMNADDAQAWKKYSATINDYLKQSKRTTDQMDSIARTDFKDFRDKIDYVFYPLSAADFLYPITLYPDADTYFLCGLEKAGSPISKNFKTNYSHYEAYRNALSTFLRSSFFITKNMNNDFANEEIDGVYSVISMLMAVKGYEIISIDYCTVNDNGEIVKGDEKGNILLFKFFKTGSTHEQTLIYFSGNCNNAGFDPNLKKYLNTTLAKHTVGTYLKAASFFMCENYFTDMRDIILQHSYTVVEDDSGIPYRFFTKDYDVTLYGKYVRPAEVFGKNSYQPDLEAIYKEHPEQIRALPFRIGYNVNSNWLVARRKTAK